MVAHSDKPRGERRDENDRRNRWSYRFRDLRGGFDRRRQYPVLGTMRDHPWLLALVLVGINLLSWIDGVLTLAEVQSGIATEGNPVLAAVFDRHPLYAVALKVGLILLVSAMIWRGRHYRIMLVMSLLALSAFAAVVAYHLGSLRGFGLL